MAEELIGIIGGTGLGDALAERIVDAELHDIDTPFGRPSAGILVGQFGKRNIAFLDASQERPGHHFKAAGAHHRPLCSPFCR